MPNINLRDARNRDALVGAETVGQTAIVRYVDKDGAQAQMRKVLKGTVENGYEALLKAHDGDLDKVGAALVAGDPEADIERTGMFLVNPARVYVNDDNRIVYRIVQTEVVRNVDGTERERRPKKRAPSNVDSEIPLTWTGKKIKKSDALTRFVFFQKLQIVHINGLTYDFLYGIAKELAEADSLMLIGAGKGGKEPLVIRHGAMPCRGFLEGRIDGDRYVLLLHLSKMELRKPEPLPVAEAGTAVATAAVAPTSEAVQPTPAPPPSAPLPEPTPLAASAPAPRKPQVDEVIAATATVAPSPAESAKAGIRETVAAAKSAKQRARTPKAAPADAAAAAPAADAHTPKSKRVSRAKTSGENPAS